MKQKASGGSQICCLTCYYFESGIACTMHMHCMPQHSLGKRWSDLALAGNIGNMIKIRRHYQSQQMHLLVQSAAHFMQLATPAAGTCLLRTFHCNTYRAHPYLATSVCPICLPLHCNPSAASLHSTPFQRSSRARSVCRNTTHAPALRISLQHPTALYLLQFHFAIYCNTFPNPLQCSSKQNIAKDIGAGPSGVIKFGTDKSHYNILLPPPALSAH